VNRFWMALAFCVSMMNLAQGFVPSGVVFYVDGSRPDDIGDGRSLLTAKRTIQAAVQIAGAGDEIVVESGVYAPITNSFNKTILIRSINGNKTTLIDGGTLRRCATLGTAQNHTNTLLVGFTLQNGVISGKGGGVYGGTLDRCVISRNSATQAGGGAADSVLYNCLVVSNTAFSGGGVYGKSLYNCTVVNNTASSFCAGVQGSLIYNSIIWGNKNDPGDLNNFDMSTFSYSCTYPFPDSGDGNSEQDPRFVNDGGGDYRLLAYSPCLNSGWDNYSAGDLDVGGGLRHRGVAVDKGAYEGGFVPVTFDVQGGHADVHLNMYEYSQGYSDLPVPTKEGNFGFAGWWTEPNAGGAEIRDGYPIMFATNHTVYARWIYTVHDAFDLWGWKWDTGGDVVWTEGVDTTNQLSRPILKGGCVSGSQRSWVAAQVVTSNAMQEGLRVYWRSVSGGMMPMQPTFYLNGEVTSASMLPPPATGLWSGWSSSEILLAQNQTNELKISCANGNGTNRIEVGLVAQKIPISFDSQNVIPPNIDIRSFWTGLPYYIGGDMMGLPIPMSSFLSATPVFAGWWTAPGGSGAVVTPATIATHDMRDVTLYAQWIGYSDLNGALGTSGFNWTSGGDRNWQYGNNMMGSDVFVGTAMQSGSMLQNNQSSWLQTVVTGPCAIKFWWKVSSEGGFDILSVSVNGVIQDMISGNKAGNPSDLAWKQKVLVLPSGRNFIRWTYAKDGSSLAGSDCGWVDQVEVAGVSEIELDAQGGVVVPSNVNVIEGSEYGVLPTPTRSGYVFAGWWTQMEGGVQLRSDTVVAAPFPTALYARWSSVGSQVLGTWWDSLLFGDGWKTNQMVTIISNLTITIETDADDYEARIARALATLITLGEDPDMVSLLQSFGVFPDYSLLAVTGEFSTANAPLSNEVVDRIASESLPRLLSALADLMSIPEHWTGSVLISPVNFPVDEPVFMDRGDLLLAKAFLNGIIATIKTVKGYDLSVDYNCLQSQNVSTNAPLPQAQITVDGEIIDWENVPIFGEGQAGRIEYVKIARDGTNLYLFVRLTDEAIVQLVSGNVGFPSQNPPGYTYLSFSALVDQLPDSQRVASGVSTFSLYSSWGATGWVIRTGNVVEMSISDPMLKITTLGQQGQLSARYPIKQTPIVFGEGVVVDGQAGDWHNVPCLPNHITSAESIRVQRTNDMVYVCIETKDTITPGSYIYISGKIRKSATGEESYFYYSQGWASPGMTTCISNRIIEFGIRHAMHTNAVMFLDQLSFSISGQGEGEDFRYGYDDVERVNEPSISLNQLLDDHPDFMGRVRDEASLTNALFYLRTALILAKEGDTAIMQRTDSDMHFFEYNTIDADRQEQSRQWINKFQMALDGPQTFEIPGEGSWDVFLGALYQPPYLTRRMIPRLTDSNGVYVDTIGDPTFNGFLPGMSQALWEDRLGNSVTTLWQIETPFDSLRATGGKKEPRILEMNVMGKGTLSCKVSITNADELAYLMLYLDGVKQTRTFLAGGSNQIQEIQFTTEGRHIIQWKFWADSVVTNGVVSIELLESAGFTQEVSIMVETAGGWTNLKIPCSWADSTFSAEHFTTSADYTNRLQSVGLNGMRVWSSYVLGLNPMMSNSVLRALIRIDTDGHPVIDYSPKGQEQISGIIYRVKGKVHLSDKQWSDQTDEHRFFHVEAIFP